MTTPSSINFQDNNINMRLNIYREEPQIITNSISQPVSNIEDTQVSKSLTNLCIIFNYIIYGFIGLIIICIIILILIKDKYKGRISISSLIFTIGLVLLWIAPIVLYVLARDATKANPLNTFIDRNMVKRFKIDKVASSTLIIENKIHLIISGVITIIIIPCVIVLFYKYKKYN